MKTKKPYIQYIIFLIICMIFYIIFRNSLSEIWKQVCTTNITVLVSISIAAILYHFMEGHITFLLASQHREDYTFLKGLKNSFYASFYRVVTLGSAGGVSAIYNLHLDHISVSSGIGLYFVGYVIHKVTILLYGIFILAARSQWVHTNFSEYRWYFVYGYLLGIAVLTILVLLCVSPYAYRLANIILTKLGHKFPTYSVQLKELDDKLIALQKETSTLLKNKWLILRLLFDNMLKLTTYYIIPYLIFMQTGTLSAADSISLVAIIYILAAAIPTPSGVGSIEAVYVLLGVKFMTSIEAAASMLLFRFATMIVPCVIGGIYIVCRSLLLSKNRKSSSKEGFHE
ncbi:MAG: lysylphosphatidylglycerol synthase transmembrane domain-containing protein [bacterium]|nr:lysylphosphatidylglycerol synthase transmembrane domain-containing protein [bacterium]